MDGKTANERRETLGELITARLLELGWSNAELARRTGFSTTYIGNLARDVSPGTKTGKPKRIPDDTVERIAGELGVPIDRARAAAGLAKKQRHAIETVEEALDSAMFFDQKGLSDKDRETLRPLLEIMDREVDRLKHTPAEPKEGDTRVSLEEFFDKHGQVVEKIEPPVKDGDFPATRRPLKNKLKQ